MASGDGARWLEAAMPWRDTTPSARVARWLFAAAAFVVVGSALAAPPTAGGDATEYVLMTESLFRHATPELRPADVQSVARMDRRGNVGLDYAMGFLGYFDDPQGRWYCYHFWAYPLLALPARALLTVPPGNGLHALPLTNAGLLLLALHRVLFRAPFRAGLRVLLFLLLFVSPLLWFVRWPHAEVMIASSATLALVGSYRGLRSAPILWATLATLQAPPFALLLAFVWARRAFERPRVESALAATLAAAPVLVSPLFYYWHFGTPSLVARESASLSNLSALRALDLLLDLNLGLGPYMPVVAAVFVLAAIAAVWRARKAPWDLALLAATIVMALATTTNGNWNSGTVGPSRYAVWLLPTVLFLVARFGEGVAPAWWTAFRGALAFAVALQAVVVVAKGGTLAEPDNERNSYLARLVLRYAPARYNPDHRVFEARATSGQPSGPWIYADAGGCRKALARPRPRHVRELKRACGSVPAGDVAWLEQEAGPDEWRYVNY